MVAVETLQALDDAGVAKKLFKQADMKGGQQALLLEFVKDDGGRVCARIFDADPAGPHVLYFPAEFDTDATLEMLGKGLNSIGYNLISFEYPEVGLGSGPLSLVRTFEDGDFFSSQVIKWIKEEGREGPLVYMGRSYGCSLALDQALKRQEDTLCLILESAFDKGRVFLERSGIDPEILPTGPIFENRKKMAAFKKPVMFIHSPRDEIQGLSEVEWLVAESRSKATQFQIAPTGTRQDLARQVGEVYLGVLKQWVDLRRGIRPPRKRRSRSRTSPNT